MEQNTYTCTVHDAITNKTVTRELTAEEIAALPQPAENPPE